MDVEGLIERLRAEAAFFRQNRPVTETTSTTEELCDEAAEALSRQKAAGDAMKEALQSIHQGAELGRALFEERVHDRKDRLTWWAVNVLQDHLACSGATAERALTTWNSIGDDRD